MLFIITAWVEYDRSFAAAANDAQSTVERLRDRVLEVVQSNEQTIEDLDQHLQGMTWAEIRASREPLANDIRGVMSRRPQISAIGLTDGTGREWVSVSAAGAADTQDGSDMTNHDFWTSQRDADRGTLVTRTGIGTTTRQVSITISRRRTTPDGRFDGTINTVIEDSYLKVLWRQATHSRPGARILLLRDDGQVLALDPASIAAPPRLASQSSALMPATGAGVALGSASVDGVRRITAASQVGSYKLIIVYEIPLVAVLGQWARHLVIPAAISVILAGALLLAERQARNLQREQARRAAAEKTALEGQRLEVLGHLAAGVAHDFANVVQAVATGAAAIGCTTKDERVSRMAKRIGEAARHGKSLTHRMLDFAKDDADAHGDHADQVVHPIEAVSGVTALLSATLGANYKVRCDIVTAGLPAYVRGNRSELAGAIMNLAVNARDAMPEGGEVVIRMISETIHRPEDLVTSDPMPNPAGLAPGRYARISVTDTGSGMPPDVLARASEPFFTTKPRGRGTGLGLAGARRFALGFAGGLHIHSTQNVGTIVTFWLPAVATDHRQDTASISDTPAPPS